MTGFEKEVLGIIKEVEMEEEARQQERDEEIKEKIIAELEQQLLASIRIDMMQQKKSSIVTYRIIEHRVKGESGYLTEKEYRGSFVGMEKSFSDKKEVEAFGKSIKEAFSSDVLESVVEYHRLDCDLQPAYMDLHFILNFEKIKEKQKKSH